MNDKHQHGICRICSAHCPLLVETRADGSVAIHGDKNNPVYGGFTCIKGRESHTILNLPSRLLSSRRRKSNGDVTPISWRDASAEIGDRVAAIVAQHGPRSVATYLGTYAYFALPGFCAATAFMEAIGSRMTFTSGTIDQPGKVIGPALHGPWLAGTPASDSWEAAVLVGTNPVVTMNGALGPNPSRKLLELRKRGVKLIVIDPRETETASHADILLQCRPGTDAEILAGLIHVLIRDSLIDQGFVAKEASGLDALTAAVTPFTPERVAAIADIAADDLVAAAHLIGSARSGVITGGTGINMSGQSSTGEYLLNVIRTLRGWWLRAGDRRPNPGALIEPFPPIAASPGPFPAFDVGEPVRVRGLAESAAGMPTAALVDEILTPGEGRVRALFVVGGNPLSAFPDQEKAQRAMRALDLLVCVDPRMSTTAREADYVLAPKMALETTSCTAVYEWFGNFLGSGFGYEMPYAQVSGPVMPVPAGSDLAEDWQFFYAIAQRMGLPLSIRPMAILDPAMASEMATPLDMTNEPSTDDVWRMILKGSPVSYDAARAFPEGRVFERPEIIIQPKPEGWPGRFDIAATPIMENLETLAAPRPDADTNYPWLLISRRLRDVINSNWHDNPNQQRAWRYNPAFMNPADLERLGASPGDLITLTSPRAEIFGVIQPAPDVKPGCVSMSHCWGRLPDESDDPRTDGSNTNRLVQDDVEFDRFSGIPRMSGVPVMVRLVDPASMKEPRV